MVAYRRPKNLKDVLVGAKLKGEDSDLKDKGMKKCGKSRCHICKYDHEGCNFAGAGNAYRYFINHSFHCDSVGVIYLITCKKCANNMIILKKMLFIWQEKDEQRTRTKYLLFIRYNEQNINCAL